MCHNALAGVIKLAIKLRTHRRTFGTVFPISSWAVACHIRLVWLLELRYPLWQQQVSLVLPRSPLNFPGIVLSVPARGAWCQRFARDIFRIDFLPRAQPGVMNRSLHCCQRQLVRKQVQVQEDRLPQKVPRARAFDTEVHAVPTCSQAGPCDSRRRRSLRHQTSPRRCLASRGSRDYRGTSASATAACAAPA